MTTLSLNNSAPRRAPGLTADAPFIKFVILINGLVPGMLLLWDAAHQALGADSVNAIMHTTGMLTLIFLSLSLLVTPLRKITGLQWLFHARRALGLYAFFYGCLHFLLYMGLERAWSIPGTITEIFKRPYLVIGSAALLCLIPLAATSFNAMIKRLGAQRWKALHRLAYVAAALAALHFYLLVKKDETLPLTFAAVITVLFVFRLVAWATKPKTHPTTTATRAPSTSKKWQGQLRVEKILQETPHVRTFRLTPLPGNPFPFPYLPGQHLNLTLHVNGKKVHRSYTIASSPTQARTCELTIKREDLGTASRHLHDELHEGDFLDISAAAGDFTFTGNTTDQAIALLAAGVGITPLMSILRYLTDRNWPGTIHLIYSNKTESDIIFRTELDDLAARHPNLHITYTLTRPLLNSDKSWPGRTGRIDAPLLTSLIPHITEIPSYICGPTEMIAATTALLKSLGTPQSLIHTESFGTHPAIDDTLPYLAPPSALAAATYTVTFSRSNIQAPAPADKPLLEVAESLSIPVESDCRSGICGTCKCRLIAGTVDMPTQDGLTPDDRAAHIILLCQARPRGDVTIDA